MALQQRQQTRLVFFTCKVTPFLTATHKQCPIQWAVVITQFLRQQEVTRCLPVDWLTTGEFNLQTLCGFLCQAGKNTSLPPVYTLHWRPKKVMGTGEKKCLNTAGGPALQPVFRLESSCYCGCFTQEWYRGAQRKKSSSLLHRAISACRPEPMKDLVCKKKKATLTSSSLEAAALNCITLPARNFFTFILTGTFPLRFRKSLSEKS